MLVKNASLRQIETEVLCLPVEFAQCGCWQWSQHQHRYFSTLIRWKPEQQVPQSSFPFSSAWILQRLILLSHEKMSDDCQGAHVVQPWYPAGCLLAGQPGVPMLKCQHSWSWCSALHEEATATLLPVLLSHLLLPAPFLVHRHSILQPTIFGLQVSPDSALTTSACEDFEVSTCLLRQTWYLGTGETCRLHQVDRCKHAVPRARRMHIYLKQQTSPLVCSVLDYFNLFLTSFPIWEVFSHHIVQYVSCFCSWPSLFSH